MQEITTKSYFFHISLESLCLIYEIIVIYMFSIEILLRLKTCYAVGRYLNEYCKLLISLEKELIYVE